MARFGSLNPALTPILVRVLPFAAYIGFLAISKSIPDPLSSYAIRIAVVTGLLVLFAGHYVELRNPPPTRIREWLIALATGVGVFLLWINLDVPWLSFGQKQTFDPTLADGQLDWQMAAVRILGASAVVPVMEELFWRSLVLRSVDKGDFLSVKPSESSKKALVASSVLFGFEHELWFAGVLAGLAYGWLYTRTGNLWVPVLAHGLTNFMLGAWIISTGNWQFW
jgi:CAAX prenyl protease-like protein